MADSSNGEPALSGDQNVLDIQGALNRLGGRKRLYSRVLKKFLRESKRGHETIARHLEAGDKEAASRLAHTFKGASAAIGAMDLCRIAGELEKAINEDVGQDHKGLLIQFGNKLKTALSNIEEYLAAEEDTIEK